VRQGELKVKYYPLTSAATDAQPPQAAVPGEARFALIGLARLLGRHAARDGDPPSPARISESR
jgi:hypothetical protein